MLAILWPYYLTVAGLVLFFASVGLWAMLGNSSPYELPRGRP